MLVLHSIHKEMHIVKCGFCEDQHGIQWLWMEMHGHLSSQYKRDQWSVHTNWTLNANNDLFLRQPSTHHQDQLSRELEDTLQLCHTKDEDHARLAEEHGAVMAREAETETRFGAELERIRVLQMRELDEKEQEVL